MEFRDVGWAEHATVTKSGVAVNAFILTGTKRRSSGRSDGNTGINLSAGSTSTKLGFDEITNMTLF
jgi:hypothetical protein